MCLGLAGVLKGLVQEGSDSVMSLCRNFMHVGFHVCLEFCLKLNEFISACDDLCLLGFLCEEAQEPKHSDWQLQISNKAKLAFLVVR